MADVADTAQQRAPSPETAGAVVLVVDDQPANVAVLERLLTGAPGIDRVIGITDPRQTVRCFYADAPDLVLLDLHMPHVDGIALLGELGAAIGSDDFVPLIVLTADATFAAKERALAAGASDFLTKPFERTEVLLRVRNLLETRTMHRRLAAHNERLKAEVDGHAEHARRAADEQRQREERIAEVLEGDALTMVFQPIVDLGSATVVGAEALARFATTPARPPNEWFAEAFTAGLGVELELLAVQRALGVLEALPDGAYLSINVSPATAAMPGLAEVLAAHPAERVVVELTEHERIDEYDELLACLAPLRERGVRVAVDDAGAGYAGLQQILRLRPDIIKLDTDLTRGVDADPARRALVTSLVAFALEIGASIVAEGIETTGELAALRQLGVAHGQGYHLARPGPLPLPAAISA